MHLTLKLETTRPAAQNFLQQQAKFDAFIGCYNAERPHQALAMRCPAELYTPSPRPYAGLPDLQYPFHDKAVTVTTCHVPGMDLVVSQLYHGFFDDETCRLEATNNPFGLDLFDSDGL